MSFFTWKAEYATGIQEMDNQHKRLVAMLNELYEAMKSGHGSDKIRTILEGLVAYTKVHFKDEESWLRSKGYPDLAAHMMMHHSLLKQVADMVRRYNDNKQVTAIELTEFLKSWLQNHILKEDKKYGSLA